MGTGQGPLGKGKKPLGRINCSIRHYELEWLALWTGAVGTMNWGGWHYELFHQALWTGPSGTTNWSVGQYEPGRCELWTGPLSTMNFSIRECELFHQGYEKILGGMNPGSGKYFDWLIRHLMNNWKWIYGLIVENCVTAKMPKLFNIRHFTPLKRQ